VQRGICDWAVELFFFQEPLQAFQPSLRLAGILPGHVPPDVLLFLLDEFLLGFHFL
jgi:hypothetical protein